MSRPGRALLHGECGQSTHPRAERVYLSATQRGDHRDWSDGHGMDCRSVTGRQRPAEQEGGIQVHPAIANSSQKSPSAAFRNRVTTSSTPARDEGRPGHDAGAPFERVCDRDRCHLGHTGRESVLHGRRTPEPCQPVRLQRRMGPTDIQDPSGRRRRAAVAA